MLSPQTMEDRGARAQQRRAHWAAFGDHVYSYGGRRHADDEISRAVRRVLGISADVFSVAPQLDGFVEAGILLQVRNDDGVVVGFRRAPELPPFEVDPVKATNNALEAEAAAERRRIEREDEVRQAHAEFFAAAPRAQADAAWRASFDRFGAGLVRQIIREELDAAFERHEASAVEVDDGAERGRRRFGRIRGGVAS